MDICIQDFLNNKNYVSCMQQNNTKIIVLHFEEIWKQKKQTAFYIIQCFEIFKKDL